MSSYDADIYEKIKGALVKSVSLAQAEVVLNLRDGRSLTLMLDGDCCSHSYFQDLNQFKELLDATVLEVEERHGTSRSGMAEEIASQEFAKNGYSAESTSWHFLVFKTDKGHVTIDWRNDSNGYYDGWVCPSISRPSVQL